MKKTRMISLLLVVCMLMGTLTACGTKESTPAATSTSSKNDEVIVFKMGHVNGMESAQQICAEKINELLEQRLPKYRLDIYPNGQLGQERDMSEAIQLGTLDMLSTATTPLANFVPELSPLEILFLIQNNEHADKVFEGEIGDRWLSAMDSHNIHGLAWLEAGFRIFECATKPIAKVDDIKGLKLRVMENQMHVTGWKEMGVDAITTSWGDAITGMQQGTMDAIEAPLSVFYASGVYDVCKNISETNHLYTAHALIMSEKAWAKVAEEDRAEFTAICEEAAKFSKQYNREQQDYFKKQCQDHGVVFTDVDPKEWQARGQAVIDIYKSQYAEDVKAIQALAK